MQQFEIIGGYICVIDTTRYDTFYGFRRIVVIDAEDDYQQHNLSVSGLNQILQEYQTALSAVSEIPVTVLFGRSPGGLSSTG